MKLRIHGNTLRLRLSQKEVTQLGESASVEDSVDFAAGGSLNYSVERGPVAAVDAILTGTSIRFRIPDSECLRWIASDEVGLTGERVVIEKDFQCLHRNSPEDADSFPNPAA